MNDIENIITTVFAHTPSAIAFTSVQFIAFFSLLYAVFSFVPSKPDVRNKLLLVFSLYFYFRLSGPGIVVLLLITASDFLIARQIHRSVSEKHKTWLVICSTFIDLAALAFFKYANFFLAQWSVLVNPTEIFVPASILIPIGISYYVFKSLGYVIDIYRGKLEEPETDFLVYLLYTSFFATIIAGPISRARELLPQFHKKLTLTNSMISAGLFLIVTGLFKKVFIADFIAMNFLDRVIESPVYFSGFENFLALIASPIQVYCDFSGYTDMALGFGLLFGLEIKNNFNAPFTAKTVTEFWRRWHITLLDWFNEYLFSPLSLALRSWGKAATVVAILTTFLLSGLWHGAAWTFIIWGTLHGLMLVTEYFTASWRNANQNEFRHKSIKAVWAGLSFLFIAATFVLFKSSSLASALMVFEKMLYNFDLDVIGKWFTIYYGVFFMMLLGYTTHFLPQRAQDWAARKFSVMHWFFQAILIAASIYIIYQTVSVDSKPFIYLEF